MNFQNKWWIKNSNNRLLKKLKDTGTVNRLTGSSRLQSAALKKLLNWLTIWFWFIIVQVELWDPGASDSGFTIRRCAPYKFAYCIVLLYWKCVPYLSALRVWSRQCAMQIHIYLTLPSSSSSLSKVVRVQLIHKSLTVCIQHIYHKIMSQEDMPHTHKTVCEISRDRHLVKML